MSGNIEKKPLGYEWRTSRWLIGSSITIAFYSETLLYGFLVPIMDQMLESRLHIDPSRTQFLTSALLTIHGLFALISAPVIAHFADKASNRKTPLLVSLGGCIVGTLLIALTPSLWALFLGRVLQAVAGSGTWIIGLALLTDNVAGEHLGRVLGTATSVASAGVLSGPLIAGVMLQLTGYWAAWSFPLVILALDVIARLIMIEPRGYECPSSSDQSPVQANSGSSPEEAVRAEETTTLLPKSGTSKDGIAGYRFYRIMLWDMRAVTGLTSLLLSSMLITSMNNVLPEHLRKIFGWDSSQTGSAFLCLQLPSILCGGLVGRIRDSCGLKIPTTVGWILSAPLIFCLGIPGHDTFPWAGKEFAGEAKFIGCLFAFGLSSTLARGAGTVQLTYVARDMETKHPHVFGGRGGSSRVFSMTEVAYSLGMMLGPLLSGILVETIGFYLMTVVLATMCTILAILSLIWLDGRKASRVYLQRSE
ncbi:hypothetical protein N7463_000783 [Penicillium fimorum]|uniref:Major facilitator superfamily (MFS) profile domain-containing protein n=1 Tax=Penicillium fimorum TaxID=1882269 RepID=A0A9X0CBF7_9EURO|nr:hypothetical protein N7463_000783 [Penicillium fimorum]